MSKMMRNEDAFTGLEAAIVLIAFIVVAAVFSYVVLGAGFFTTQKSQEVVHTGVAQASSNMEVSGPVVIAGKDNGVQNITFYLQLAAGGSPIDMNKTTYAVATKSAIQSYTNSTVTMAWYKNGTTAANPNNLLEKFEFVKVTIENNLPAIGPNEKFIVEIRPVQGASYPLERNAPPSLAANKFYEVY
ncbi:archaellin/type IV pilin N-terminal domain-containing protein [Methanoculleus sp. MH98A]|uniref:archaellin/type IV pilin N-terminal domain-containing protein n=1 Tax=Methanoculleus sp. MH98A TaxID=1495314 RepID=UPI0004A0102C|nr:archaellin/type IV pilin N-terminal domain-containing protein [Methanoculleus sp. MH98A]KDE54898.1 flagellin [Methanoculleus sp. MH98A]